MALPVQIGTGTDMTAVQTNDTNCETNETNDVIVTNPDGSTRVIKVRRKKKRFEQPAEALIQKIQRLNSASHLQGNATVAATEVVLDPALDAFIKLKLVEWDADASGTFSQEEVVAAMDDLRDVQQMHRHLKWQFMQYFVVVLLFLGCMLGAVFLVLILSTTSSVGNNEAQMRAPVDTSNNKVETPQTAIVETTGVRENGGLEQLLEYDTKNDQWTISDSQLRKLDQVSFKTLGQLDASGATTSQAFYNLDLAEIIRIDAGPTGNNDQVNMITTGGHDLRLWENVSQLEIRWKGTGQWRKVDVDGSAAAKKSGGRRVEEANLGVETAGDPLDVSALEPPSRRLSKGGVVFVGGYHHGHSSGGGGGGCRGRCNVPFGTVEGCDRFCNLGACYEHRNSYGTVTTYVCRGGARGLMTPLSKWLWQGLTIFMLVRGVFN